VIAQWAQLSGGILQCIRVGTPPVGHSFMRSLNGQRLCAELACGIIGCYAVLRKL